MTDKVAPVRPWDFDRVFRLLLIVAGGLGLFWLLRYLADVLIPFAVALLLAYLLHPIVNAFQTRLGGRRGPAVFLTVCGAFVIGSVLVIVLVPIILNEFAAFGDQIRQLGFVQELGQGSPVHGEVGEPHQSFADAYRAFRDRQPPWLQNALDRIIGGFSAALTADRVSALLQDLARRIAPGLLGLVSGAVSFLLWLTGLVVVLVYLVFILLDYERVSRRWPDLLPPVYKDAIVQFVNEFALAMKRYFRGQVLISAALGIVCALGFKLIGLRLGIPLGLFVGLLSMVPYLQVVALVPAALLGLFRALETGSSVIGSWFLVLLVFAVAQTLQDLVLTPRIMGKTTGLRPVVIMLGVFVWGKLLGFLGLVLAIPLTCLGIAYYSRFVLGKLDAKVVGEPRP
ncbi:MAG: AI-2E family transporter [Planctomycetota bacterium]